MLFNPSHPGEVLKDYLGGMTVKEAAKRLRVTRPNLSRILNGHAGISAAMSVRLAKAMPYTSPEFWLKMQLGYDLSKAQKSRQPKIKPFPVRRQKELASA
jgi:addiction module HigA family antidote